MDEFLVWHDIANDSYGGLNVWRYEAVSLVETDRFGKKVINVEPRANLLGLTAIDNMIASLEQQGFPIKHSRASQPADGLG